jgi:hypothetical protein
VQRAAPGLIAALVFLLPSGSARAEGLEIGASVGAGLPIGDVDAPRTIFGNTVDDPLSRTVAILVPIGLEVGGHVARSWTLGGSLTIAPAIPGSSLGSQCTGISCTVLDFRIGFGARYHFRPEDRLDPWLGAGLGYEWLHVGASTQYQSSEASASGFELARLEAGLDWGFRAPTTHADGTVTSRAFRFGPFVELTLAQYDWRTVFPSSSRFDSTARHGWLMFGLRFAFDTAERREAGGPGTAE